MFGLAQYSQAHRSTSTNGDSEVFSSINCVRYSAGSRRCFEALTIRQAQVFSHLASLDFQIKNCLFRVELVQPILSISTAAFRLFIYSASASPTTNSNSIWCPGQKPYIAITLRYLTTHEIFQVQSNHQNLHPPHYMAARPNGKRPREAPNINTGLIEIYEDLASENGEVRLKAALRLLSTKYSDTELDKILNRLFRGLCSSRKAARLGFSIALTEFLAHYAGPGRHFSLETICQILTEQTETAPGVSRQVSLSKVSTGSETYDL